MTLTGRITKLETQEPVKIKLSWQERHQRQQERKWQKVEPHVREKYREIFALLPPAQYQGLTEWFNDKSRSGNWGKGTPGWGCDDAYTVLFTEIYNRLMVEWWWHPETPKTDWAAYLPELIKWSFRNARYVRWYERLRRAWIAGDQATVAAIKADWERLHQPYDGYLPGYSIWEERVQHQIEAWIDAHGGRKRPLDEQRNDD